jgi:NAD(P)-dependent dehydrogenase (short-subunit alcohol dehydrogenase family)
MNIAIVGSSRGIGLSLVRTLVREGHNVYAFCRSLNADLAESGCAQIIQDFDVSNEHSIHMGVKQLDGIKIDWLFHVAGIMRKDNVDSFSEEDLFDHIRVNTVGPVRTILALAGNMGAGSKAGVISSRMGSIMDNESGDFLSFRISKTALNMALVNLAKKLKEAHISVFSLHPGYVKTQITGFEGEIEPDLAAQRLVKLMAELELKDSGTFWHANGSQLPW